MPSCESALALFQDKRVLTWLVDDQAGLQAALQHEAVITSVVSNNPLAWCTAAGPS